MKIVYKDEMIILGKKTKVLIMDHDTYDAHPRALGKTNGTTSLKSFDIFLRAQSWDDDSMDIYATEKCLYHEVGHIVWLLSPNAITEGEYTSSMFEYAFLMTEQIKGVIKRYKKYLKNKGLKI